MCLCDFKMCGSEKVPVGYRLGRGEGMSHVDAWAKLTPGRAKAYAKARVRRAAGQFWSVGRGQCGWMEGAEREWLGPWKAVVEAVPLPRKGLESLWAALS